MRKLEVALTRPRDAASYRRTLTECLAITLTAQAMTENLLTLARLDAGQIATRREPLDLSSFVRGCWDVFADRAAERSLVVEWQVSEAIVVSDPDRLRLVVNNLMDNAVSYTDEGGIVRLDIVPRDGQVCLRLSNSGNRLDAEAMGRCCDRFWRGEMTTTGAGEHCGLGLALVQRLTVLMEHAFLVTAEPGGWFCAASRFQRPRRQPVAFPQPRSVHEPRSPPGHQLSSGNQRETGRV